MARNRLIYAGNTIEELWSVNCLLEDSLTLDSLPVDILTAEAEDTSLVDSILSGEDIPEGEAEFLSLPLSVEGYLIGEKLDAFGLKRYNYGEIVQYYHDNDLIGKFYLESIKRLGFTRWQFNCTSGIGLLMTSYHWGGMYTGQAASSVIADVIGGIIPYTLDASLASVGIYGWLGKGTRRDNLRNVLFAIGGRILKDSSGNVRITPFVVQTPYEIKQSEFYLSGGNVTGGNPATEARVTEHSYFVLPTDEQVTLYDGIAAAETIVTPNGKTVGGVLVDFTEPIHDLEIAGASILESGVNYAVISNSSRAVLTGKRYTHTQRIVSKAGQNTGTPNVVTSSDCHLINFMNSDNVANRLIAFYGSAKSVEADIILSNQKPGDMVTFKDPFGDETNAYIESLDIVMSNTLKARASFVADFVPPDSGNLFTHRVVLTGKGSWPPPSGVKVIRYALFSGACGGRAGRAGEASGGSESFTIQFAAANMRGYRWANGGKGGAGGAGGSGSRILDGRMDVTPGVAIPYSCGTGGTGAAYDANRPDKEGSEGTETTLGSVSSASGSFPSSGGWVDVQTGQIYATSGQNGLPGGDGAGKVPGQSPGESLDTVMLVQQATSAVDEDGKNWPGGVTETDSFGRVPYATATYGDLPTNDYVGVGASPGLGPGGAAGTIASTPTNGRNYYATRTSARAKAADGNQGCTPTLIPKKPGLTIGGRGGYGGGGGSAPGMAALETAGYSGSTSLEQGSPGLGGDGGPGGPGGDGMIIIYY